MDELEGLRSGRARGLLQDIDASRLPLKPVTMAELAARVREVLNA